MKEDLSNRTGHAAPTDRASESHARREPEAIALLCKWLAEDSGYDERVWPAVKKGLEESRLSERSPFRG